MREAHANCKSDQKLNAAKIAGLHTRTLAQAFAVAAVLALWVGPPASAQSSQSSQPSQAAQPAQNANANSNGAPQPADANTPQMVDQSGPAPDSLGEAARKAKAAKAKSGDASATTTSTAAPKIYNNENLGGLPNHGVSVVGPVNSKNTINTSRQNNGGTGADESYWRSQAQEIHAEMADIDREIARVKDDIAKNGAVSIDPSSGARQGVVMVEDRNTEIKHLQDQKDALQESLEQLADAGRKAGADPGWFR
jgi:hypothetical protein